MTLLLIGATGLLGSAVAREAARRDIELLTAARSGASLALDIGDSQALAAAIEDARPQSIVNCAALVDVAACEANPELSDKINTRPAGVMADWSRLTGQPLIHVSTDHFFTGDGARRHREDDPVNLVNQYARSKYASEALASAAPNALILRLSPIGFRGWPTPTLVEWAIKCIEHGEDLTLFEDAYTSSLDSEACARAILDLLDRRATGLLNVGSREVYSKADLIRVLARHMGHVLNQPTSGSIGSLVPPRADSLGLDISRAEHWLGYKLSGLETIVADLVRQYRTGLHS